MDNQNEELPESFTAFYKELNYNDPTLAEINKGFANIRQVDNPAAHRILAKKLEESLLDNLRRVTNEMQCNRTLSRAFEVLVRLETNPDKDLSDIFWNIIVAVDKSESEQSVNDEQVREGKGMALILNYISSFLGENMAPPLKQFKKELSVMTPAQYNTSPSAHFKAWVRAVGYSSPRYPELPNTDRNPFQREP